MWTGSVVAPRKACPMFEDIQHELITRRRAFSLVGLSAALTLAVPVTWSAISDAEVQTAGMDRREGRHDRREDRRDNRQDRRETRRGGGTAPVPAQSSSIPQNTN